MKRNDIELRGGVSKIWELSFPNNPGPEGTDGGQMPDPIQPSSSSSYLPVDGRTAEENSAQACLSPVLPPVLPSAGGAETKNADIPSPAVASLVTRFNPPVGSHPPVEPSLQKAIESCSWEIASATLGVATILVSPGGLLATVLTGARGLLSLGTAERCIERDEARQVREGETANASADCERDGAVPLLKSDGSVVCASQ